MPDDDAATTSWEQRGTWAWLHALRVLDPTPDVALTTVVAMAARAKTDFDSKLREKIFCAVKRCVIGPADGAPAPCLFIANGREGCEVFRNHKHFVRGDHAIDSIRRTLRADSPKIAAVSVYH